MDLLEAKMRKTFLDLIKSISSIHQELALAESKKSFQRALLLPSLFVCSKGGVFRPTQSQVLILSPGRNPCELQSCLTAGDRSKGTFSCRQPAADSQSIRPSVRPSMIQSHRSPTHVFWLAARLGGSVKEPFAVCQLTRRTHS